MANVNYDRFTNGDAGELERVFHMSTVLAAKIRRLELLSAFEGDVFERISRIQGEIASFGGDISKFVHPIVAAELMKKK